MDKLIELHLHLDGSLRPETVWELAKEQNIKLPANTVDEVRDQMQVPEDCRTLEEYLTRFDLPLLVLQTREALERAAFELTEDLAKEGVTYAEIRFAPQLSIKGGMTQEQAVEAAIEGVKRGMEQYLVLYARGGQRRMESPNGGNGKKISGRRCLRGGYCRSGIPVSDGTVCAGV